MDTTENRDFTGQLNAGLPRFFNHTPQVSAEIGEAWATAWQATAQPRPTAAALAPRTINPRRGR